MKKLILGTVSAIALLGCGAAFAAGSNVSTVSQTGTSQAATIDQISSTSGSSTVTQTGWDNNTSVTQSGSSNTAVVTQSQDTRFLAGGSPDTNVSLSNQTGNTGRLRVRQDGASTSSITQGGSTESALVLQAGYYNTSAVSQSGSGEFGLVAQLGNSNQASISQSGTGDNLETWNGNPFTGNQIEAAFPFTPEAGQLNGNDGAVIDVAGTGNVDGIIQAGANNWADISATGSYNGGSITQASGNSTSIAWLNQVGDGNNAALNQLGGANAHSTAVQNGNSNQAYVNQTGTNYSSVQQGSTTELYNTGPASNGGYASVTQSNTTGGVQNNSRVEQHANASAFVTQIGNNDISTVLQTAGSSNSSAAVYQQAYNNTSHVTQSGASSVANVNQWGNTNLSDVTQGGGSSNNATVNQYNDNNTSTVTQNGTGNVANVAQ